MAKLSEGIIGSWRAVYAELDGEMVSVDDFSGIVITFDKKTFKIAVNGDVKHAGTYSISAKHKPARITYVYEKSSFYETGKPRVGIIQLAGNTFKDCLGGVGAQPPKSFNTGPKSDTVMTIHQKIGVDRPFGLSISRNRVVSEW